MGEEQPVKTTRRIIGILILLTLAVAAHSYHAGGRRVFFQYSTIQALMEGVYDGNLTFRELEQQGDFGLGTLNALDGEMIGVNGKFYQIRTDGRAYPVPETAKTPFAEVTFFHPDQTIELCESLSYPELEQRLKKLLPSPNLIYGIKITGTFPYVKTRSVPRQQSPYPPLAEVVKRQAVFEFHNVRGVLVGFWLPAYLAGVNVAGYHLHFITEDRRAGGHVLDCRLGEARVEISQLTEFALQLPLNAKFLQKDLIAGEKEIGQVER
jgi:acetolactate decarboxylase